jgi:hypothetical protein
MDSRGAGHPCVRGLREVDEDQYLSSILQAKQGVFVSLGITPSCSRHLRCLCKTEGRGGSPHPLHALLRFPEPFRKCLGKFLSDLLLPPFSPFSYFLDFFAGVGDGSLHLDAVHSSPSLSRSCCCRIEKSAYLGSLFR